MSFIPVDEDTRREALAYVDAGHSIRETAAKYGVHRKTVGRWLRKRGRSLRNPNDAPTEWRCSCTPFGTRVVGLTCSACGADAPWAPTKT